MSENGADILNGRGLLETIRLADRALELEKELAALRRTERLISWAENITKQSRGFKDDIERKLASGLHTHLPFDERRHRFIQEIAAKFVVETVRTMCQETKISLLMDHAHNRQWVRIEAPPPVYYHIDAGITHHDFW